LRWVRREIPVIPEECEVDAVGPEFVLVDVVGVDLLIAIEGA
jgi:hypothetical protein